MTFRDDPVGLRAWLDRKPPTVALHCEPPGSARQFVGSWRSFPAECACVPVPVVDGTFGWVMRLGECHANGLQAATVATISTNEGKIDAEAGLDRENETEAK